MEGHGLAIMAPSKGLDLVKRSTIDLRSQRRTPVVVLIEKPPIEAGTYKFSSTQVNLPTDVVARVKKLAKAIPDKDLAADGREDTPHVTIKYGLHTNDAEDVAQLLADEPPVTVTFGATSFFPDVEDGTADAVKLDISSPDLRRLNKKIADALKNTESYPTYKPHATVAYVKPGLGQTYAGNAELKGQTATIDRVRFSAKDGSQTDIRLTGTPKSTATMSARTLFRQA